MVLTALAVGVGCGLVNGAAHRLRPVVPFIATLAMLAGARGLAEIIADGAPRSSRSPGSRTSSAATCSGIPVLVWIFALVAAVGWVVLNRTTFGRRTFAVGGNPEAARLAGINVKPAHRDALRASSASAAASPP